MFLKCCYYDVSHLEDPQIFAAALHQLSWKARAEKVNRYRFEKDKRLCLGAGLLAQHMLEQAGVSDPVFSVNEFGKPVLSDRSDIHFNISHDGTLAVCVVCDRQAGIDVQKITAYDKKLASRVFQQPEISRIENSADPDKAFTQMWTRKESYVKMLGKGLSLDPGSFSVLQSHDLPACFSEFDVDDHHITVCTRQYAAAELLQWQPVI